MTNSDVPIRGSFLFNFLKTNMEKEQILSTINEKLTAQGIKTEPFQRTFGDYLNENLPAEGTEPDDAYFDKHVRVLKSLAGQYSHDFATAVEDFKKNYKPQPENKEQPDDKRYAALEEKFDKLMGNYEKLTERLAQKESQQTQEQLMSQVKAEMKKQGATDDYVLKQTLRGVTLDTKKSVADLAKELLTAYDSELTACRGKGAAPRNGGASGGPNDKPFGGYFAQKKAKEGWGKDSK